MVSNEWWGNGLSSSMRCGQLLGNVWGLGGFWLLKPHGFALIAIWDAIVHFRFHCHTGGGVVFGKRNCFTYGFGCGNLCVSVDGIVGGNARCTFSVDRFLC